jgi:hypothetical protein
VYLFLFSCILSCSITPPLYSISFPLPLQHTLIMRCYTLLAAAAPLVLALPAPAPAPVAAPAPKPLPLPQGVETGSFAGLVSGLINGVFDIGSLSSAVPEIISDLRNVLDSAGVVTGETSSPPVAESLLTNFQRPLQTVPFLEPMFLRLCRNCSKPFSRPPPRRVSSKRRPKPLVLLESHLRINLHRRNRIFFRTLSRWFWTDLHQVICKL